MTGLTKSATPYAERKKGKQFLNQSDTLKLAISIAESKEEQVHRTVQQRLQHTQAETQSSSKTRKAHTKAKLTGIKERMASDRARLKKNKAKMRKHALMGSVDNFDSPPMKKRVSFA